MSCRRSVSWPRLHGCEWNHVVGRNHLPLPQVRAAACLLPPTHFPIPIAAAAAADSTSSTTTVIPSLNRQRRGFLKRGNGAHFVMLPYGALLRIFLSCYRCLAIRDKQPGLLSLEKAPDEDRGSSRVGVTEKT